MENMKWHSPSQDLTTKYVSYPQLTATNSTTKALKSWDWSLMGARNYHFEKWHHLKQIRAISPEKKIENGAGGKIVPLCHSRTVFIKQCQVGAKIVPPLKKRDRFGKWYHFGQRHHFLLKHDYQGNMPPLLKKKAPQWSHFPSSSRPTKQESYQ